ncbi:hypothetical protein [Photobacterium leiognathi]|uniref:hypothetical protein n=1 Tax=Photobacterium leiognathi TaxID=553611 RepID=UPI002980A40F|nr:hypothetical protein [Photobacterium leiognathi]
MLAAKRNYTINDQRNSVHFTVTNSFSDSLLGEPRRFQKSFPLNSLQTTIKLGHRWQLGRYQEFYGYDRGNILFNNPTMIRKMKFGGGVTSRRTIKRSGHLQYDVYRIQWTHYDFDKKCAGKPKERVIQLDGLSNKEIREKLHLAGLFEARLRTELTLSTLDKKVFDLEFDLSAMPDKHFVSNTKT